MSPALVKEIRALLPTFAGTAATVGIAALLDGRTAMLVLVPFCWGVITLGAHSIGHEYTHRTLGMLLAHPRSRGTMLGVKAAVLVPMVLALALLAVLSLPGEGLEPLRRSGLPPTLLVLATLSAVSVAPLLSMLCRGTLPAVVFTIAIPGVLLVIGEFAGTVRYGLGSSAKPMVEAFKLSFVSWTFSIVCAAAAAGVWWQFRRLQAIEGHRDVQLPAWFGGTAASSAQTPAARVRHPAWALLTKEVHLQHLSFVVVALYVVAWLALNVMERYAPEAPRLPLQPLTVMYFTVLAVLIGSVASAEERQLGTLSSQVLLPMAAWKQWSIKAGTAIGLAVLLGIGLPLALYAVMPMPDDRLPARLLREPMGLVILLSTLSLYVSTLCGSAVRAMVAAIPIVAASMFYTSLVQGAVMSIWYRAAREMTASGRPTIPTARLMSMQMTTQYVVVATATVMVLLLLRFAFVNHLSGEQRLDRMVAQATLLIAVLTLCLVSPLLLW